MHLRPDVETTGGTVGLGSGLEGSAPIRVFISYAVREGKEHNAAVRRLAKLLRKNGVDAELDRYAENEGREWSVWMEEEIDRADFVLVVVSPAYRRAADGEALPDEGRGVRGEVGHLRELIYRDRRAGFRKVIPVVLP